MIDQLPNVFFHFGGLIHSIPEQAKHLDELALRTKGFSDLSEWVPELICQRDDGGFQLGWSDDAPGPFPSRAFAAAVAARRARIPPLQSILAREDAA